MVTVVVMVVLVVWGYSLVTVFAFNGISERESLLISRLGLTRY